MAGPGLNVPAPILYLRDRFGGDFEEDEGDVAVDANGEQVVGNDPEAVALVMINLGSNPVYLRPKAKASATQGIYLQANGGEVSLTVRDDFMLPTRDWYAVSVGGASTVYFLRLTRFNTTNKA